MRSRNAVARALGSVVLGSSCALQSTFVGERTARATYPEVMGCEVSCEVVATGWPLVFIRDYTGMSVVNSADISEVVFAADKLDLIPFGIDAALWSILSWLVLRLSSLALARR